MLKRTWKSWADTAVPSVVAIHGYNSTYPDTWCAPEADSEDLGPLMGLLSPFSRIFAFEADIKEDILFDKSHLENAAADLLNSLSQVQTKVVFQSTYTLRPKMIVFLVT